jgi:HEAT repeat protein
MKTKLFLTVLTMVLVQACSAQIDINRLERSIEKLQAYQYDKTNGVDLRWVELEIGRASVDSSVRARVEDKLIKALAQAEHNDAKQFLCRQLRTIGSARCVVQLESMLTDPAMSHMARYALGRIDAPEAHQALHRALAKTSGKTKAGLINTLVKIEYAPAASDILKLMHDSDSAVSMAAIRGAGQFGDQETLACLQQMRKNAAKALVPEIDAAVLCCARGFVSQGETASATAVYQAYYRGTYPEHLRVAGLRGLARIRGDNAAPLLVQAIKGDDPSISSNAIAMLASIEGKGTTHTLVSLAGTAPAQAQALIAGSLGARGDISAAPVLIDLAGSAHEGVRRAALRALGDIGTAPALPCLAQAAATGSADERQIARSSLIRLQGKGMDQAFMQGVKAGDASMRVEVIRALGQRLEHGPFHVLHDTAKEDAARSVRREAILSMGRIGLPSDLKTLVSLLVSPQSPGDRDSIERAIRMVFSRMEDRDAQAGPVLKALDTAPDAAKPSLLRLLARPATDDALEAVRAAAVSTNREASDAAIRSLGAWPNPAPVEQLHQIAARSPNQTHRVLALRGYIRLAALTQDPTSCFESALKLAQRKDEVRLILGALHHAGTRRALEIAESYMKDPALKAEAYMAAAKVANVYCWEDRAGTKALLDRVIAEAPNSGSRNQARAVLRRLDEFKSIMAVWKGTPAFVLPGVADGRRVFETVFAPERDFDAQDIIWRIVLPEFEGGGKLDLEKTYGRIDYCCAYLRCTVHSPVDQEVRLKWTVDDQMKAWLSGKSVNQGPIHLQQGANAFIVKVGDHGGGWSFRCEMLNLDESPIPNLRFER